MGRYETYRAAIMDEPRPTKLGNRSSRETHCRPVDGCLYCPLTYHSHQDLGPFKRSAFLPPLQLHGSHLFRSTFRSTSHQRANHCRLGSVDVSVSQLNEDFVQGCKDSANPSRRSSCWRLSSALRTQPLRASIWGGEISRSPGVAECEQQIRFVALPVHPSLKG